MTTARRSASGCATTWKCSRFTRSTIPRFRSAEYPLDTNNIAPRIGLTFDPRRRRGVVRGGYGRFYDKTHFELISAILTAGAFSDSFIVNFPTNNVDSGPSNGCCRAIRCSPAGRR